MQVYACVYCMLSSCFCTQLVFTASHLERSMPLKKDKSANDKKAAKKKKHVIVPPGYGKKVVQRKVNLFDSSTWKSLSDGEVSSRPLPPPPAPAKLGFFQEPSSPTTGTLHNVLQRQQDPVAAFMCVTSVALHLWT